MLKLVYCDWIANLIRNSLIKSSTPTDDPRQLSAISNPQFDLDSNGVFLSTKKTIFCQDGNNTKYRITVEEVRYESDLTDRKERRDEIFNEINRRRTQRATIQERQSNFRRNF